ncbi:YitT family protein [Demequina sp. B12]|uniref:YitT family protein n=1 Tax=Demequina sp. B12 TaxID=2992757 RepID=UPI00237BF6E7|nr:YitT family protein [Demequina sp. B12]MDE0573126.1 YitT family protein [Demequina sp. B12]
MSVVDPPIAEKHALWEDALALPSGAFLMSFGLFLLESIEGVSGGLAGVAILGSYWTGISFGIIYFLVNAPFYWLAAKRMGWKFTIKTLITVTLVSVFTAVHGLYMEVDSVNPLYGAIFAGLCIGVGMIMIFRHGSSAGGFGILAAYCQERYGIRAGYVQGALDLVVVLASLTLVSLPILLCSIVGAVLLNLVLAINHRPGRYFG